MLKTTKNRIILALILGITIGWVLIFPSSSEEIHTKSLPPPKPNLIIFSIDTLRADHLGCYGYQRPTSPHIDSFAKDCILFMKAISQAPTTTPAHMSILTGLTPLVHQVSNIGDENKYQRLDDNIVTLAEILKDNGYINIGFHGGGISVAN